MYTIKRWNGEYGNTCQFIVEDENGQQTLFNPANPDDVQWVKDNLADNAEYGKWSDFNDEQVEVLEAIVM